MSNDILSEQDYEAIEAAVMETERGRWFLREYAARNRVASTSEILDVLSRIESRLAAAPATRPEAQTPAPAALISAPPQPAVDISVISGLIAAARGEMAALRTSESGSRRMSSDQARITKPIPQPMSTMLLFLRMVPMTNSTEK